jgi:hypothetical protein
MLFFLINDFKELVLEIAQMYHKLLKNRNAFKGTKQNFIIQPPCLD